MAEPLIVNNTYLGSSLPVVTAATGGAGIPDQIYRNTDNTMFVPTRMILTNITATGAHRFVLVDADLSDAGEDTYQSDAYDVFDVNIGASETLYIEKNQIPSSLRFRYGVAGYVTNAAIDVTVYIEGYEILTTSTE